MPVFKSYINSFPRPSNEIRHRQRISARVRLGLTGVISDIIPGRRFPIKHKSIKGSGQIYKYTCIAIGVAKVHANGNQASDSTTEVNFKIGQVETAAGVILNPCVNSLRRRRDNNMDTSYYFIGIVKTILIGLVIFYAELGRILSSQYISIIIF